MRFCQTDGTPLGEDAPLDPYKTMVARPGDIAAAMPPADASEEPIPPPRDDEQVLEIPAESDPNKTMYASEEEIRREMDAHDSKDEQVIDIPPLVDAPAPPKFNEPEVTPPSFGGTPAPPSPFSTPSGGGGMPSPFTTPPIPSPFSEQKASTIESTPPPMMDPESAYETPQMNPFNSPGGGAMAQAQWTPPPAPDSSWQNQQIGQNTPFQPPASGTGSLNQTLPIVSLVLGIISLCCYVSPLTGIGALVTGYLALKNIKTDPSTYGGRGLAIAGMAIGGVFLAIGLLYWIIIIFFGGLGLIMNAVN